MYSLISIILLVISLNLMHSGIDSLIDYGKISVLASALFAIAGAIGSVSSRLGDLYYIIIKKKDKLDGTTEIKFEKRISSTQDNEK